ncbi:MAG: BatD family protein [Pirellulaceae bacterium]
MNKIKKLLLTTFIAIATLAVSEVAKAQDVRAQISTREAYVGMPVILQLQITDADDYDLPDMPNIDGCRVESGGAPAQSSQITIINGRRSESRSITMQYLITPLRGGSYEIPALEVNVDGRKVRTQPQRFVATRSETGDLLFAEIEGGKEKVFVGQPLDLTLKIWVKPYRDRQNRIELSQGQMWQMLSSQTRWGSFSDRMQELTDNRQRPGGQPVLRDNGQGDEREYYLYEIDATVYPTRAGKIDASDVQIVVNYPIALGKSRDPFADFFEDSPLSGRSRGGSSLLKQMMDDDFFSSPFGNRLSVTSARPIVADVKVDSTEVLPVPVDGRPSDYRGAVGRYQIVTEAEPTHVCAGDPITLQIGIVGDGPMELVQAPPLAEIESVQEDFKVTDQALAGFVQQNTKVFVTTIRPRREGIMKIPAIPFSFFDPDSEKFETVYSQPISITVDKAETLALDAIVGQSGHTPGASVDEQSVGWSLVVQPEFSNDYTNDVLVSQMPAASQTWYWWFVALPPVVWFIVVLGKMMAFVFGVLPSFRSAVSRCRTAIKKADDTAELKTALIDHIATKNNTRTSATTESCIGALRTSGLHSLAIHLEAFVNDLERGRFAGGHQPSLEDRKEQACRLVEAIDHGMAEAGRIRIRQKAVSKPVRKRRRNQIAGLFWLAMIPALFPAQAGANESAGIVLSTTQLQLVLAEANQLYRQACEIAETDVAESRYLFANAAQKYQLLIDAGIRNASLLQNAGNACLQSDQLGLAVAYYCRGLRMKPGDRQLQANLNFARTRIDPDNDESRVGNSRFSGSPHQAVGVFQPVSRTIVGFTGMTLIHWLLALSSLAVWGLIIARTCGFRYRTLRWVSVPLLLMAACIVVTISVTPPNTGKTAIVVESSELRAGDGLGFETTGAQPLAEGSEVRVLDQRGDWLLIETFVGRTGWVSDESLALL